MRRRRHRLQLLALALCRSYCTPNIRFIRGVLYSTWTTTTTTMKASSKSLWCWCGQGDHWRTPCGCGAESSYILVYIGSPPPTQQYNWGSWLYTGIHGWARAIILKVRSFWSVGIENCSKMAVIVQWSRNNTYNSFVYRLYLFWQHFLLIFFGSVDGRPRGPTFLVNGPRTRISIFFNKSFYKKST